MRSDTADPWSRGLRDGSRRLLRVGKDRTEAQLIDRRAALDCLRKLFKNDVLNLSALLLEDRHGGTVTDDAGPRTFECYPRWRLSSRGGIAAGEMSTRAGDWRCQHLEDGCRRQNARANRSKRESRSWTKHHYAISHHVVQQ